MVGKSLGPYKIVKQLGKGGMGEVWLAEDTRLGRQVAVKVLPAELAGDTDRRQRFEQEARAAAALNHPNIAAVHDVGVEESAGPPTHYMVQEYLQGEPLREVVARGPLPFDKALALGIEIGEALKAAHRAGIVHRDLKPDNVFVSKDGHAKVLDFGLAKLTQLEMPSGSGPSMSPTMTMAGMMLGTAGYMAPEQVRGEEIDERADLFAFGCVLYEMVTGRQAFGGDNVHESLSKILTGDPDTIDSGAGSSDGFRRIAARRDRSGSGPRRRTGEAFVRWSRRRGRPGARARRRGDVDAATAARAGRGTRSALRDHFPAGYRLLVELQPGDDDLARR